MAPNTVPNSDFVCLVLALLIGTVLCCQEQLFVQLAGLGHSPLLLVSKGSISFYCFAENVGNDFGFTLIEKKVINLLDIQRLH